MARPSRKSAIVEAAAELFSVKGYEATTVRDIAERAGVLSGSLYAHIATKEDLYLAIVRQAAEQFTRALTPVVEGHFTPRLKLTRGVEAHMKVIGESRSGALVYLEDVPMLSDATRIEARRLRRQYELLWNTILDEGIADGAFGVRDKTMVRLFLLSALNGIPRWYREDGRLSNDAVAKSYAELAWKLVAPH